MQKQFLKNQWDFLGIKKLDEAFGYKGAPCQGKHLRADHQGTRGKLVDGTENRRPPRVIATQPGAERLGGYIPFSDRNSADLPKATDKLDHYTRNV